MLRTALVATGAVLFFGVYSSAQADSSELEDMLQAIVAMTEYSQDYTGVRAIDESVIKALRSVDRSRFVAEEQRRYAFANQPLGIGHGQTISQPFIVALMTHMLDVKLTDRVLEIGTGSGYQAAILGELAEQVFTIEIIEALALEAKERLKRLGYKDVFVKTGDGWFGWPDEAPFNKIMITAVAPDPPPKLLEQLSEGGRMIAPIGDYDGYQELILFEKDETGAISQRMVLPVRFVPMTGKAAQENQIE